MTTQDLQRLHEARARAYVARDYLQRRLLTLSAEVDSVTEQLREAEATMGKLDAKCRAAEAPKMPAEE